jgi:low temperature requirement protein LtrA
MSDRQGTSLQSLVADAIRDGADLLRQELGLFKAEMVGAIGKGVVFFAIAAIFAIASLIWLTQALVYGLAIFVAQWIAALIVGVLLLVIGGILVVLGKNRLAAAQLAPNRTIKTLKQDGEVLTERVSG